MSELGRGWRPHPDAVEHAAPWSAEHASLADASVVGLGAYCDLAGSGEDGRSQSFAVSEFVLLEDGRRVTLLTDRGFTIGSPSGPLRAWDDGKSIVQDALNVVLPDDNGYDEVHRWTDLAKAARVRGFTVTAVELQGLPYEVILSDNVEDWLRRK